jgi:hypothetical protein
MRQRNRRNVWPGMDFKGQTLSKIRRRVRREREPGKSEPPAPPPSATESSAQRPEIRALAEKGKRQ